MLSLVELERVADVLNEELVGGRVERWIEPERGRLAFSIYQRSEDEAQKVILGIDARPEMAHVGRLAKMPGAPAAMPAFTAYLRAHLGRARLDGVSIRAGDRQLALDFSAKEGRYCLVLSIFGRRSNLYLLDEAGNLVQTLRPLSDTRPELALGSPYVDPGSGAPSRGGDRFVGHDGWDLLDAVTERYAEDIESKTSVDAQRQLTRAIKKERKSTARRVERLEAELAEAEMADRLARDGELLKSNLGKVESGATSVQVENWETGGSVEIPLDPKLSARENLAAIFKRYQKLLRRLTKAGGQIDSARAALSRLDALSREIENAEDVSSIIEREDVQSLLSRQGARQGAASQRSGGAIRAEVRETPQLPTVYRNLPRKLHPRRYASLDGLEIWVGRSDEGNDVLTTRLARGNDLFFHLDGAPGSHVVLRTEGRTDPPSESLLDACELAVHFSKGKKASRADVHVAPIKMVKKPKGAKRGLVYVTGGKSIHLRREDSRLERLLASRFDD
jgi:predicted ribosome quality control (RQC) complex YloA/Tae2 family protein